MPKSPLIQKNVVNRNTNRGFNYTPNPDAFTEDVPFEEVVDEVLDESADPSHTPPPPRGGQGSPPNASAFEEDIEGSPEIPYHAEGMSDGDFDHESDAEKEKAVEQDRKMLIQSVLEGMDWVIPAGAVWLTQIDTDKLEEWRKKNKFFAVDVEACKERNEKNAKTFQFITHEYTKRIENPLRRIAKDRAIDVSPESQLVFYTLGFIVIMGYYCYTINAENRKMMAKFEKAHEETMRKMERVMKEERKNAPKDETPQEVEAEEVE